jgi:amidase
MAAKDVFDIADHHSGNGHPLWLKTHPPAPHTATAVDRLLAAGAHMVGRTHSDEMAYSLDGENVHLWDINQSEGARSHSGWILKRARQRP